MRRLLAYLILIGSSISAHGQRTEEHRVSRYAQNDGLSSYNVRSVAQDPMGFMWVATQDGLNLFDGKTFVEYNNNKAIDKKILASDVRAVVADPERKLMWVLTNTGGLDAVNYITGNVIRTVKTVPLSSDDWNITMILNNGKLWVGCMTGIKIYNIERQQWEQPPRLNFENDKNDQLTTVRTLQKDRRNNIWVFVDHYGLVVIDPVTNAVKARLQSADIDHSANLLFTGAGAMNDGSMLSGTNIGLRIFSINGQNIKCQELPAARRFAPFRIRALTQDHGVFYFADDLHIYQLSADLRNYIVFTEFNPSYRDNWLNDVGALYIDRMHNVWIGCKQGLALLHQQKTPFTGFNIRNYPNSGLDHIYAVMPEKNGDILIGQEKSLVRYSARTDRFSILANGKAFNFLWKDGKNATIVSADDGLYLLKKDQLIPLAMIFPELKVLSGCYVNSIQRLRDSVLVLGSDNDRGIFIWDRKLRQVRAIDNQSRPVRLRSNIVNKVFADRHKQVWVLSDQGIDVLDSSLTSIRYLSFFKPGTSEKFKLFFDILQRDSTYWVTAYGYGILEIDRKGRLLEWLNSNNGLCNDGVYQLFANSANGITVTTNNGLAIYDTKRKKFNNYFEQDGLHSSGFEENCGTIVGGKIYAGGLNGFSVIDPLLIFNSPVPPLLYIDHVTLESDKGNTTIRDLQMLHIDIPAYTLQTSIFFFALNFADPKRVIYEYRIPEIDSKWIGLDTRNFINIIGIPPGKYTLEARSANESGILTKHPIRLILTFQPKWYQTWLFKFACILFIGMIVYALYRYRHRQIIIRRAIRKEIASDLHDDLGGTLNSIKIFSHLAIETQDRSEYLEHIGAYAANAAVGLRDMLWILEDAGDSVADLADRIVKFTLPVAEANGITLHQDIDSTAANMQLSKSEKRNLLLIAKEAITNSFKYAGCTTISLCARRSGKVLIFSIADNGRGFQFGTNTEGNGLTNMRNRAQQIRFSLEILSEPVKGTVITATSTR